MRWLLLPKPTKRQLTISLYGLGFMLYGIVFFLGLNQLAETRRVAANTAKLVTATNHLVENQGQVLTAIKGVTDDTKITAEQQTAIIICMLQVPVNQRTTNLQQQCRDSALTNEPSTSNNSRQTPQSSLESQSSASNSSPVPSSSSSNPTPNNPPPQSNNPQPEEDNEGVIVDLPLLPEIRIPSPF